MSEGMAMAKRKAALLLPPGDRYSEWYATCAALDETLGIRVVTIARSYPELMRLVWCGDDVDVGVVQSRTDVTTDPLVVIEEARAPTTPPGQRRPLWVPQP